VTYNSSRKQFFAKLLGVGGATGALSKLVANSGSSPAAPRASRATKSAAAFEIRHDARAVSRRDVI
jgi:hypothetical protein